MTICTLSEKLDLPTVGVGVPLSFSNMFVIYHTQKATLIDHKTVCD